MIISITSSVTLVFGVGRTRCGRDAHDFFLVGSSCASSTPLTPPGVISHCCHRRQRVVVGFGWFVDNLWPVSS
jgi:hypothetical protein